MSKLIVFNSVSVDGYFTDTKGDMSWAHQNDDSDEAKDQTDQHRTVWTPAGTSQPFDDHQPERKN